MNEFYLFLALCPIVFGILAWLKLRTDRIYGTPEQRAAELYGWHPEPQAEPVPPLAPRQPKQHTPPSAPIAVHVAPRPTQAQQPTPPASPAVRVLSFDHALRALTDSLHLLIVGESDAGKSTSAQAVLVARVKGGDQVLILDPHAEPAAWGGLPAVGTGRDYAAIAKAMTAVLAEMSNRYQRRAEGDTTYQPISIFIDEWPAIQSHCKQAGTFMTELAQEGRKVGLRLVILTQSDRVESLGISGKGDVRGNFTFLLLGNKATEALPAITGVSRPAVIRRGQTTVGANINGHSIYSRTKIDPRYVVDLSGLLPVESAPKAATNPTEDSTLLALFAAGSPLPFEDEAPPIHAQNQQNHRPEPVPEPPSEPGAEPSSEPVMAVALPAEVEAAAIEKWLTDGLSANAIAAKLGGNRANRLAQIREVREGLKGGINQTQEPIVEVKAA